MLHLYRRHGVKCKYRSERDKRCACPIYVKGSLGHHSIRMAIDQTDWDAATRLIADWTKAGAIGQIYGNAKAVADAVADFLADTKERGMANDTIRKYELLLTKRLVPWTTENNVAMLQAITLQQLTRFRQTWPGQPLTKQKTQERLKAFFGFCRARGWIQENPALELKPYKTSKCPTLPFTAEEVTRILDACDRYPIKGVYGAHNRTRMKAFVLLLRWTGLRIRDAVTIERHRVTPEFVFLYTQKTGTPVRVPIPPHVSAAIDRVPPLEKSPYVFWSGNGHRKSVVADWQRALRKLFELADVQGGHAHRFRDSFAVALLENGIPIEVVAVLLGHASIKVTEKHYAPWVLTRQLRLESSVRSTWDAGATADAATPDTPALPPTAESASPTVKIA